MSILQIKKILLREKDDDFNGLLYIVECNCDLATIVYQNTLQLTSLKKYILLMFLGLLI